MSKYFVIVSGSNEIINTIEWDGISAINSGSFYTLQQVTSSLFTSSVATSSFLNQEIDYKSTKLGNGVLAYGSGSNISIYPPFGNFILNNDFNATSIDMSLYNLSFYDQDNYSGSISRIINENIKNYILRLKQQNLSSVREYLVTNTEISSSNNKEYLKLSVNELNSYTDGYFYSASSIQYSKLYSSSWDVEFDLGDKAPAGKFYGDFIGNIDIASASMDKLTVTGSVNITGSLVVTGELTLSSKIKVEIFNNSTTYTIPSWAKKITAYVVGAGGGGGGGASGYMHEYANLNQLYPIQFDSNACGHEIVMGGGGGASGAVKVVDYIANKHFTPGSDMEIMVGAGGKGGSGGSPLYDLNGLYTGDGSGDVGIYTPDVGFEFSSFKTDSFVDETWNAVGKTSMHNTDVDEVLIRGLGTFDSGNVLNYALLYDWQKLEEARILFGRRQPGWYAKIQEIFESGTTALQIRIFYTVFRNLNRWAPIGSNVYNLSKNNIVNNLYKKTSNSSYYFNKNYFPLIKSNIAFSETIGVGGLFGNSYYYLHNGESGGTSYIKTLCNGVGNKVVATGGIGGTGGLSIGINYPLLLRIDYVKNIDYSMGDYSVPGGGHDGDDTSQYGTAGDNINVFSSSPGGHGVSMVTDVTTPSGYNLLFPNYMNTELSASEFKYKNTAPNLPIEYNNELPDFLERWPYFGTSTKLVTSEVLLYTDTSGGHKYNNVKYMIPNLPLPTGGGGGTGKNGFALDTREISSQTFSEKKSITNRFKSDTNPSGVIPTTFIRDMAEQIVSKTMLGYGGKCFKLNETTNLKEEFTELEYNRYGYELPVDYTQVPRTLFIGKGGNGGHININDYDTEIYGLENYDIVDPIPTSLPENGGDFGGGGGGGAGTYNPSKLRIEQIPGFELVKGQNGADGGNGVVVLIIYN